MSSINNKIIRNYQRTNDTTRFHGYNAGLLPLPSGDVLHGGINLNLFKTNKDGHTLSRLISDGALRRVEATSRRYH